MKATETKLFKAGKIKAFAELDYWGEIYSYDWFDIVGEVMPEIESHADAVNARLKLDQAIANMDE